MAHAGIRMIVVALAVACAPFCPGVALAEDVAADAKLAAAERYLKVFDMRKMMDEMIVQLSLQVPEAERAGFTAKMHEIMRLEVIEAGTKAMMLKHFSTEELNAMADFYGSAVGRSILSKFGPYMADTVALMQVEIRHAIEMQHMQQQKPKDAKS